MRRRSRGSSRPMHKDRDALRRQRDAFAPRGRRAEKSKFDDAQRRLSQKIKCARRPLPGRRCDARTVRPRPARAST